MRTGKRMFRLQILLWISVLLLSAGGTVFNGADAVQAEATVYITPTGAKYHTHKCGNGTYYPATLSEARARGLTPCLKCFGSSSYSSNNSSASAGSGSAKAKAKPIKISKTSLTMVKGQTSKLKIRNATKKVRWRSTKKSVVTVSANGKIVAKNKGKATIIAKAGNQQKKCVVTVESPELNYNSVSLGLSETKILKLSGCKHSVTWSTTDCSVVKVNKGKLTAKDVGTANVTATVHGKKFICRVTVKKPDIQKIILEKNTIQMGNEEEAEIKVSTVPARAIDYYDIFVKSSDSSVVSATLDEYDNTLVFESYNKPGNSTVSIQIGNLTAECQVQVIPRVNDSLFLSEPGF